MINKYVLSTEKLDFVK